MTKLKNDPTNKDIIDWLFKKSIPQDVLVSALMEAANYGYAYMRIDSELRIKHIKNKDVVKNLTDSIVKSLN